ncbi:hypothetical protein CSW14_10000, partial [Thermus scotoductus]
MRWGILVLTSLVLGVAWGQTCTVRYTAPNYPELPVGRPQIYLTVSPTALASPGSFTARAW